jgi:hypothetical protein
MTVTLELFELRKLFADAAELGAKQLSIKAGLTSPVISASNAYEIYGRKTVERWVKDGLIERIKHGERNSSVNFDAMALEVLSKSSDRLRYFLNLEKGNGSQVV